MNTKFIQVKYEQMRDGETVVRGGKKWMKKKEEEVATATLEVNINVDDQCFCFAVIVNIALFK